MDEAALARVVALAIRAEMAAIQAEMRPLAARMAVLEARSYEPLMGPPGPTGPPGERGPSGTGIVGAVIARDGSLVLTLSDGTVQSLGIVVGRDGERGEKGIDGEDGFGFNDLNIEHDGERGITIKFVQGERVKEFGPFIFPVPIWRGVYRDDQRPYQRADVVLRDGGDWIALQNDPPGKPGEANSGWQLSVKGGAQGKQGPQGPPGPQGNRGDKGDPGGRY